MKVVCCSCALLLLWCYSAFAERIDIEVHFTDVERVRHEPLAGSLSINGDGRISIVFESPGVSRREISIEDEIAANVRGFYSWIEGLYNVFSAPDLGLLVGTPIRHRRSTIGPRVDIREVSGGYEVTRLIVPIERYESQLDANSGMIHIVRTDAPMDLTRDPMIGLPKHMDMGITIGSETFAVHAARGPMGFHYVVPIRSYDRARIIPGLRCVGIPVPTAMLKIPSSMEQWRNWSENAVPEELLQRTVSLGISLSTRSDTTGGPVIFHLLGASFEYSGLESDHTTGLAAYLLRSRFEETFPGTLVARASLEVGRADLHATMDKVCEHVLGLVDVQEIPLMGFSRN
jgi:hypothetical protein